MDNTLLTIYLLLFSLISFVQGIYIIICRGFLKNYKRFSFLISLFTHYFTISSFLAIWNINPLNTDKYWVYLIFMVLTIFLLYIFNRKKEISIYNISQDKLYTNLCEILSKHHYSLKIDTDAIDATIITKDIKASFIIKDGGFLSSATYLKIKGYKNIDCYDEIVCELEDLVICKTSKKVIIKGFLYILFSAASIFILVFGIPYLKKLF